MIFTRSFGRAMSMAVLLLAIVSCTQQAQGPTIGVIIPVSGDFAAFGEQIIKGVEDANKGRVRIIVEDENCDTTQAANAYKKLTEIDGVHYIIGPGCGSPQEVIASFLAESDDRLAIIPNAAPEELYELSSGRLFQIQYSLEKETSFLADSIYARGHRRALVISYNNAFSKTHAQTFKKKFKGNILEEVILGENPEDVMLAITKVRSLDPDVIYVTDLTYFIHNGLVKMREHNIQVPVYATYVAELPFVRPLVEGVIFSYPSGLEIENGVYRLGYQAADLLIEAILRCDDDVACVHESLTNSDAFDDRGISTRDIGLFQIVNGSVVGLGKESNSMPGDRA